MSGPPPPPPCTPFTDPTSLSWFSAADLNSVCCAKGGRDACCRYTNGANSVSPFFLHSQPQGGKTLEQAREFCGAADSQTTTGATDSSRLVWIIVASVLGAGLLVLVYVYAARASRSSTSPTHS